jgi:voltage-gated potassium channel
MQARMSAAQGFSEPPIPRSVERVPVPPPGPAPRRDETRRLRSPASRLRMAAVALVLVTAIGTAGYMLIEGMPFIDAIFMTVTTMSTVGYREVRELHTAGRVFTMALIVFGVGTTLYLLTIVAETLLEGHLQDFWGRARMQRNIDELSGHVIVCGYGRFGRAVCDELARQDVERVIIDSDPAVESELIAAGAAHIVGSALSDEVLERAGIARARAIVIATPSDPDNVFVTLSAREKNPHVRIHARGETEAGLRRLRLAGADQVISAYQMGGMRVAASILRPSVVDFLEISTPGRGETIDLEELRLDAGARIAGATIEALEREHGRVRVVAVKPAGGAIRLIPEAGTTLAEGDLLVVVGDRQSLERLAQRCSA